jgi:hypothetical protein
MVGVATRRLPLIGVNVNALTRTSVQENTMSKALESFVQQFAATPSASINERNEAGSRYPDALYRRYDDSVKKVNLSYSLTRQTSSDSVRDVLLMQSLQ